MPLKSCSYRLHDSRRAPDGTPPFLDARDPPSQLAGPSCLDRLIHARRSSGEYRTMPPKRMAGTGPRGAARLQCPLSSPRLVSHKKTQHSPSQVSTCSHLLLRQFIRHRSSPFFWIPLSTEPHASEVIQSI